MPSASLRPLASQSPPRGCSLGGPPRSWYKLTRADAQRRWARGWHCGAAASTTPHLPLRRAAGHLPLPGLGLAPSPPDLLSPSTRPVESSPGSAFLLCCARCSGGVAGARPRAARATGARHQVGARAHRAPLFPGGGNLPGGRGPRRRQAVVTLCQPWAPRQCARSPVQQRHQVP